MFVIIFVKQSNFRLPKVLAKQVSSGQLPLPTAPRKCAVPSEQRVLSETAAAIPDLPNPSALEGRSSHTDLRVETSFIRKPFVTEKQHTV